ncbi:uncharacterized protein LOC100179680 [Ciona intestinalis]
MPPAQTDLPPDAFQDGTIIGVKELFQSYEDSLLPIDQQLLKYKKKDLHASHYHRTACRIFSNRKRIHRSHFVDDNPFAITSTKDELGSRTISHLPLNEEVVHVSSPDQVASHKSWVEERRKLRHNLNNLGLTSEWLEKKPVRNSVENRVLAGLASKVKRAPSVSLLNESVCVLLHINRIQTYCLFFNLPFFELVVQFYIYPPFQLQPTFECPSDISTILKTITKHIASFDKLPTIFTNCNRTKRISRLNCKEGLLKLQKDLPISAFDIKEILRYFYENSEVSLWKVLSTALKSMEPSVGQPLQSIESSWTLSSIDDEESNPIELGETEKKRNVRLKEFEDAVRICKENDVVLSETLLRKVLLHPGDDGTIRDLMQLPPPGSSLSKDFWRVNDEKKKRRKISWQIQSSRLPSNMSVFSMAGSEASSSTLQSKNTSRNKVFNTVASNECISEDSFSTDTLTDTDSEDSVVMSSDHSSSLQQSSGMLSNSNTLSSMMSGSSNNMSVSTLGEGRKVKSKLSMSELVDRVASHHSLNVSGLSRVQTQVQRRFGTALKQEKSKISSADTTTTGSAVRKKAATNLITFPKLRDVAPERHHVNLSTGRALVSRKVDCWLTFEEYERLTSTLEPTIRRERPIPNAFWPGHLLDKLRLCLSPCTSHPLPACDAARSKNTSFYQVKRKPHNGHRANYGYDNNERTWPTDGKYVKYGNVDSRKVYHI